MLIKDPWIFWKEQKALGLARGDKAYETVKVYVNGEYKTTITCDCASVDSRIAFCVAIGEYDPFQKV